MKRRLFIPAGMLFLFFVAACDSGAGPDDQVDGVADYMSSLPSWTSFSPRLSSQAPTATAEPTTEPDVMLDVEVVNDDGTIEILPDVAYSCQTQPFTLTDNPQQIALYSPDVDLLWPGALIQGKSHRDGLGSLLGLPIAERTPIEVSIPSLANDDNFRTVDTPSQAEVAQAIGSMIGNATASGLSTPSTITFTQEVYHSESQFALSVGLSGHYLGFEASAKGSVKNNASKTTITAQFYQKMFEVVVAPPQSPDAFFSSDFSADRLQQQVDLGRIGPDNLPVYVSNVVYGRMMMFSMTSTASESEMRATLRAAYEGIGGGGAVNLSAKQKSILEQSEIRVTSLGGNAEATLAVIRSGNWADYFTDNAPLSSASPLSYTFRNLGDGSIASVSETTEYNVKTCEARAATPGTFNFLDKQSLSLPIGAPAITMMADVDGDGDQDIVWNHVSASTNETVVAFSNGDGTFSMGAPTSHSAQPANGWSQYKVKVGDFNNDGRDDLAWGRVLTTNTTYIGLSNGDGTFQEMPMFTRASSSWGQDYQFGVGDVDGKNGDDLVWNHPVGTNRTYVTFSNGDGTFGVDNFEEITNRWQDHPATAWTGDETWTMGDFNGDGRDDLIWYTKGFSVHHVYFAESVSDVPGQIFSFRGRFQRSISGWQNYDVVVGNIDGVAGVDLVWMNSIAGSNPIHRDLTTGGTPALVEGPLQNAQENEGPFVLRLLDVNGDGRKDLLMNTMGTVNRSFIGLGTASGSFDLGRVSQDHPAFDDWSQFTILVGDINDDGREDVIYNNADASNDIYVGLAKE
ncbi:MAG: thiol-activated cytolysin family protein [Rhodothermales bacterium]